VKPYWGAQPLYGRCTDAVLLQSLNAALQPTARTDSADIKGI
jgi:hypothetical protein